MKYSEDPNQDETLRTRQFLYHIVDELFDLVPENMNTYFDLRIVTHDVKVGLKPGSLIETITHYNAEITVDADNSPAVETAYKQTVTTSSIVHDDGTEEVVETTDEVTELVANNVATTEIVPSIYADEPIDE